MGIESLSSPLQYLFSPAAIAACVALGILCIWTAFSPAKQRDPVDERLGKLKVGDVTEQERIGRPFISRVLLPVVRGLLRGLGRLTPKNTAERTHKMLIQAGEPGGLTALDFFGLRLLLALLLAWVTHMLLGSSLPPVTALRNALLAAFLGFLLPWYWLRARIRHRKSEILRALPDGLDMLTVGVEAGLAFESALLRVAERWDNALTREFRRMVTEMRVGTAREEALQRMADRVDVSELSIFVTVLIQSTRLGVSIAQVLHVQAGEMRLKRRQRAEELARQAGIKMVFALTFFIFPAILVVILGPSVPAFLDFFGGMSGGFSLGGL